VRDKTGKTIFDTLAKLTRLEGPAKMTKRKRAASPRRHVVDEGHVSPDTGQQPEEKITGEPFIESLEQTGSTLNYQLCSYYPAAKQYGGLGM